MKKIFVGLLTFLAISASVESHASILLEPYVGYDTGTLKATNDYTVSGLGYGARLGIDHLGFMAGVDYMTGSWSSSDNGAKTDFTPSDIGIFVGYNFPILLRAYGEYIVSADNKATSGGGSNTAKGTGIKLGVGFRVIPLLSINLEYIAHTYTKDDNGSLSSNTTDQMYGLNVSLPFEF